MHRGSWESSSFPRIAGVQWSSTVGSTLWGMASGVAVILASSSALRRSRRRPDSPSRRCGRRCRVYHLPDVAWWPSVGPAGQGLAYICAPSVMGHVAVPAPLGGVRARALRGSGSHVEVPDPSRGEVRASGC